MYHEKRKCKQSFQLTEEDAQRIWFEKFQQRIKNAGQIYRIKDR